MIRARGEMRWPPFVYQIAEKWSCWPEEVADQPYTAVIDLSYFCTWESEDYKLQKKFEGKRGEQKARLAQKLKQG